MAAFRKFVRSAIRVCHNKAMAEIVTILGGSPSSRLSDVSAKVLQWIQGFGWKQGPPLPSPCHEHGCSVVNEQIIVFGGLSNKHTTLSDVWALRPGRSAWEGCTPMPFPLCEFGSAASDQLIYVCGGITSPFQQIASVLSYNVSLDVWDEVTKIPDGGLSNTECAVIHGQLFVVGGRRVVSSSAVYAYDLARKQWHHKTSLPHPRHGHSLAVADSLYCIGGSGLCGQTLKLDEQLNQWIEMAPMPTPRFNHHSATIRGKIYIFGGFSNDGSVTAVDCFNPATDTWTTLPSIDSMPLTLSYFASVTTKDMWWSDQRHHEMPLSVRTSVRCLFLSLRRSRLPALPLELRLLICSFMRTWDG